MSTTIKLTDEQLTSILEADTDVKYQLFNDSAGASSINENSTFPDRLKFYMEKKGVNASDVVAFFKTNYPFLAKSTSSIQHYVNGVRTPRLSAVFALADFLDIAPALLLPAKPGKYIEYRGDHVEMITPEVIDGPDLDPEEVTELIPGTLDALNDLCDISAPEENNNVVVSDQVTSETEDDTTTQDESSTTEETTDVSEDDNVVIEEEDYIQNDPQVHEHPLGAGFAQKDNSTEDEDEIKPATSLEVEEDDFDTTSASDDLQDADNFLKELFGNAGSTPYDEYTKPKNS
tara:strand:+ start:1359 stop:2225 length:867 start_codon:yes stop_codon:yes gene_type:complete